MGEANAQNRRIRTIVYSGLKFAGKIFQIVSLYFEQNITVGNQKVLMVCPGDLYEYPVRF